MNEPAPRRLSRPLIIAASCALLVAGGISFYNANHAAAPLATPTAIPTPAPINTPYIPTRTPAATPTPTLISATATPTPDINYVPVAGYMLPAPDYPGGTQWELGDALPPQNVILRGGYATTDDYKKVVAYYHRLFAQAGYDNPTIGWPTTTCGDTTDCQPVTVAATKDKVFFSASISNAKTWRAQRTDTHDGMGNPFKLEYQAIVIYSYEVPRSESQRGAALAPTPDPTRAKAEAAFAAYLKKQGYSTALVPDVPMADYTVSASEDGENLSYRRGTSVFSIAVYVPGNTNLNAQQSHPLFRGVRALYQNDPNITWRGLWWTEPGFDSDPNRWHPTFASYVVSAKNMDEDEFWRIAKGLSPAPGFSRTLAGVSLGMTEKEVLAVLGEPQERTSLHGNGSPEWVYVNGIDVVGFPVSRITISAPYVGGTTEGFKLGDSPTMYGKVFSANADKLSPENSLSRRDALNTTLDIHFDAKGHATHITLTQESA